MLLTQSYYKISFLLVGQLFCLSWGTSLFAQTAARLQTQEAEKRGDYFSYQTARVTDHQPYLVQPGFTFTSAVLQIDPTYDFEGAYIVSGKDTFLLHTDEHAPEELERKQSGLVIFAHPVKEFIFYPAQIRGDIIFNFLNAGELALKDKNLKTEKESHDACAEPAAISQKVWREGLPAPIYTRSFSETEHIIIHHAASSNTATNYTEVVRNIYLWHTQTNMWSDIGYNYLIAQDGTIFKGRDPDKGEQDNVTGAHFCRKNTGTMGICLLGTYTDVAPTDTTVASLLMLISWKANKDHLNPLAFKPHGDLPLLGVIAGHRDGCSTECPGDKVYEKIPAYREFVDFYLQTACEEPVSSAGAELKAKGITIYPVPAKDEVHVVMDHPTGAPHKRVQEIKLVNLNGKEVSVVPIWQGDEFSFSCTHLPAGIYALNIVLENKTFTRKIVIAAN